jgi:hypothetical protein
VTPSIEIVNPHLVLEGLRLAYERLHEQGDAEG